MKWYEITVDGGGGGDSFAAENAIKAISRAKDFARAGEWGDRKVYVEVYVEEYDKKGGDIIDTHTSEVIVGDDPKPPECFEGHEHKWVAPHQIVGGCKENPGVMGLNGTQYTTHRICARCGVQRHYTSESTPGNYPRIADKTVYEDPTEKTLAFAAQDDVSYV